MPKTFDISLEEVCQRPYISLEEACPRPYISLYHNHKTVEGLVKA